MAGQSVGVASSISFRIAVSIPFSVLIAVNLVSMTARSFGTVKSGNRAPKLVAMAEIASGKDAGDGLQVFCRDAQDDHLAVDWHHNESPLGGRSAVDCLLKSARAPFAVNIRREFEKCKPRFETR